jgi:23S rRNA (adenine2503-C2)-methyltransferase
MTDLESIGNRLLALGAREVHVQVLMRRWLAGQALCPPSSSRRTPTLPSSLMQALHGFERELDALAQVESEHPGADGSVRLLVRLSDGQTVESVLLPRGGLCVSTQVGCAVGCRFCATGREGLLRQISTAEILAQVVLARRRRSVNKVVFMGMGEPAHNLEAVIQAIQTLGTLGGIGHKNLVFSTVGDLRVFERLPNLTVKPALAVSLHTTRASLRQSLLPNAPRIDPKRLIELAQDYAARTGYPIQYQWTLLQGVNDGEDEVEALADLLQGHYAVLNFIPYNTVEELPYQRPSWERAAQMARTLHTRGVLTKLRQSAGQDVEAGCGQLRARSQGAGAERPMRRIDRAQAPGPAV